MIYKICIQIHDGVELDTSEYSCCLLSLENSNKKALYTLHRATGTQYTWLSLSVVWLERKEMEKKNCYQTEIYKKKKGIGMYLKKK